MYKSLIGAILVGAASAASANLLTNGSFEDAGVSGWTGWGGPSSRMNVYNDDGANGHNLPGAFGNFSGVLAASGDQFVAGLANVGGVGWISQVLSAPLQAGQTYRASALLHQALRVDLDVPSSYTVVLSLDTSLSGAVVMGTFTPTVSSGEGWVSRALDFVAPGNALDLTTFTLVAHQVTGQTNSYAGLDAVELNPVPEPFSVAGLALGGLWMAKRKRSS